MNTKGFALEASLFVLLLVAVLVADSVTGVVGTTRTAGMDYRGARVTYAAEAGADPIMANWTWHSRTEPPHGWWR
jgi:hypothetical protein